jgi:serine/threonine protein kinase
VNAVGVVRPLTRSTYHIITLYDKRTMNESCIGLREQRLLDKSTSAGHSGGGVATAAASSTGTLSSAVAEENRLEQAAVELCDQVLHELDEDSKFFVSNPPRPVAMFHSEGTWLSSGNDASRNETSSRRSHCSIAILRPELRLGDVLGQGEFGTVREVREVSLSQRKLLRKDSSKLNLFDEAYTEKDEVSGLSKMDRDRLTVRQLSYREGRARYAIKRVREDLVGKDRILASLDLAVEARFLASLTHPNIVRMRGAGGVPGGPLFVIVMDRLYGTLEERLAVWRSEALEVAGAGCAGFQTRPAREWGDTLEQVIVAYDVSRALNFLHEHRYVVPGTIARGI